MINNTRVIFAKAGCSLLSVANQYELPLGHLLEFNDLKEEDVLAKDQLLFLQRKRRTGATSYHIVRRGETLYDICQSEGLRYEDLVRMNPSPNGGQPAGGTRQTTGMEQVNVARPAAGEKIWLKPKGNTN
jgi:LysM repeat protein